MLLGFSGRSNNSWRARIQIPTLTLRRFTCSFFFYSTSPESTKQFFENKYKTVQGLHQVFTPGHTKSASDSKIDVNGLKGRRFFRIL